LKDQIKKNNPILYLEMNLILLIIVEKIVWVQVLLSQKLVKKILYLHLDLL